MNSKSFLDFNLFNKDFINICNSSGDSDLMCRSNDDGD